MTFASAFAPNLFFWIPTALLLLALPLGIYLYYSLRVELRVVMRRGVTRAEFDKRLGEIVTDLETFRTRLAAAESLPAPQPEWAPQQALNLNRRGQILRLHDKGRSVAEIASDLQISQGEVELIVKVHDWSANSL